MIEGKCDYWFEVIDDIMSLYFVGILVINW